MSDFPPPPPLPDPAPAPGHEPMPVAALAYSLPTTGFARTRPGLLTALGSVSILVACFSALASLGTIAFGVAFYIAAKAADLAIASQSGPTTLPAFLAPVDTNPPAIETGPNGLPPAHRRLAVNALQSIHPLTRPRQEQLDAMLARAGKTILAVPDAAQITSDKVREAVVDHGEMFGRNRKTAAPEYFRTQAGRLELYDDRAVFYPDNGSAPVRSTTAAAAAPRPLTPEQISAVVKQAQAAPGGAGLNPAQVSSLTNVLSMPNQRLAQASVSPLSAEPRGVTTYPSGGTSIRFTGGELHLGPRGQLLGDTATAAADVPSSANSVALVMVVVAGVASLGLAVFLMVAGIAVLRDAPARSAAGRRLHRNWAFMKIPVAVAVAAALWWMLRTFDNAAQAVPAAALLAGAAGRVTRWTGRAYWFVSAMSVAACLYPVVVLLVLRAKSVRTFYEPVD